jgi:hypothetical protein
MMSGIPLDQNDSNHVSLENEIFLYQSGNIHLIPLENEISLDQNSDQSDNNHVLDSNRLILFTSMLVRSLTISCDILLKNTMTIDVDKKIRILDDEEVLISLDSVFFLLLAVN